MRTLLIPVAAAAVFATSAFAFAAGQHATGTVKAYDSKTMMLTLADGSSYKMPKKFKDPGLKMGEKVQISYAKNGTERMAEQVKIVK